MSKAISRRDFLKVTGAVGAAGLLAACGGKAPVEPAETALYGKVTIENAPANALGTVVYLGYYESADAMKAELPEVLKDLPLAGYFLLYISFSPRMNM